MLSIFNILLNKNKIWHPEDNDVAITCVIKSISCPYCGSTYPVITLGALRRSVEKKMYQDGNKFEANPEFKYTHLSNPIECPVCKRKYMVFVGVEYNRDHTELRGIHVKIAKLEDPLVKENIRWPHGGLVAKKVIEFNPPGQALLYDDIDHYMDYNEGGKEIKAGSLANISREHANTRDRLDVKPPDVINLDNVKRPPPPPKHSPL